MHTSIVTECRSVGPGVMVSGSDMRELLRVIDTLIFIIFIVVMVSWMYTNVRYYTIVYFVLLYICVVCILYTYM